MGDTGSVAPECSTAESMYRELSLLICLIPILQADLTMENDGEVTCSDASESGGAVAKAESLTWSCLSFVGRQLHQELEPVSCPILVISCFNGIGGSFRIYDVLGVRVMGKVTIDNCGEASRVTRTTWPEVEEYPDNVGS